MGHFNDGPLQDLIYSEPVSGKLHGYSQFKHNHFYMTFLLDPQFFPVAMS